MNKPDRHQTTASANLSASLLFAVLASAFQGVSLLAGLRAALLPWLVLGILVPIAGLLFGIAGARKDIRFGVTGCLICAGNLIVSVWFLARHTPFVT